MKDKVRYRVWVKRSGGYTPTGHEPFTGMHESIARGQCARYLKDGEDFFLNLTKAKFESLNAELFKKCLLPVESAIKDSGISKSAIDEIVLVDSSTRIPKVQTLVKEFFGGKEPSRGN